MNIKSIVRVLSTVMIVISFSMVPSMLISIHYRETEAATSFFLVMLPVLIVGFILFMTINPDSSSLRIQDGMLIVVGTWGLASLIAALPICISGAMPDYFDALFEAVSGLTTTGASILTDIESLPKGILFWRSFLHFLGGMGILLFTVAIMPALGINGQCITNAESTNPTKGKLTAKMSDTAKILYAIYIGLTVLITVLLMFGGMSLYDALIHAFGTVATAGFSNYNDSVGHFNSYYIDMVIAFGMLFSGISFNVIFNIFRGKFREVKRDSELKFYLCVVAFLTILFTIYLKFYGPYDSIAESFRYGFFQITAIITTTGFSTTDYGLWPSLCILLLFILMFFGACSSSTTGSIKCVRILLLLKVIRKNLYVKLHPRAVVPIKLNGKPVKSDTIYDVFSFVTLYLALFAIGSIVLAAQGLDVATAMSSSAAMIGNIGPGFGSAGPSFNYAFINDPTKIFLSLYMIAGRLEIYALFMIFTPRFWMSDR